MTHWMRCPAVLILCLTTLVVYLRSDPRGLTEITPPDTPRSERLLLRKPTSAAGESSTAGPRSQPGRLAAESKGPDSALSETSSSLADQPAQPLPGSPLDPISPSFRADLPKPSRESGHVFTASEYSSSAHGSGTTTQPRATRRAYVKHRVVNGDDLRSLAARYLNDADRYLEIFHANRDVLAQPDLLPLGAELQIPTTLP